MKRNTLQAGRSSTLSNETHFFSCIGKKSGLTKAGTKISLFSLSCSQIIVLQDFRNLKRYAFEKLREVKEVFFDN